MSKKKKMKEEEKELYDAMASESKASDEEYENEGSDDDQDDEKEESEEDVMKHSAEILKQIQLEYDFAYKYIKPKWDTWQVRLKLYNNQKRSKDAIGDPLLFTIFQTVLASLYSDKLTVEFVGREHGDDECAENQTILAQYDSEEMMKEQIDYEWIWDTLFFGRGILLMDEWDGETQTPIPQAIDPLTFFRDPDAHSVNGDKKGRNAARFMGREIRMTKFDIEQAGVYVNYKDLKADTTAGQTPVEDNQQARRAAQGFDLMRDKLCGDNESYILHEWWTWWNGKKYCFTTGKERTVLMRAKLIKTKKWPLVDRSLFPSAHEWDGVSVADLVEDKQRGRAVLLNLAKKAITAKMYPSYVYDNTRIKNKADIIKFEFNKFIGVAGSPQNVVAPIDRQPVTNDTQWLLDNMDFSAQKSTATPDIQQGAFQEKVKSATEIAKVTQGVDTRYALSAKIFAWSERAFWKLWYEMYSIYFKNGIQKKIARISGPFGPSYREILPDNLVGDADPDIIIESKAITDAKRMNRMNMLMAAMNQAVALDPNANKRFLLKELLKAMGMTTDEINRALPKTFDEYEAEEENMQLDDEKLPRMLMTQNHLVHIEIHSKAADTKAKARHIALHKYALYGQTHNQNLNPNQPVLDENGQIVEGAEAPPGQPEASPMEQGATPSPRDMAQSALMFQAPTAVQQVQ